MWVMGLAAGIGTCACACNKVVFRASAGDDAIGDAEEAKEDEEGEADVADTDGSSDSISLSTNGTSCNGSAHKGPPILFHPIRTPDEDRCKEEEKT